MSKLMAPAILSLWYSLRGIKRLGSSKIIAEMEPLMFTGSQDKMPKVLFILRRSQRVSSYSQGSFGLSNSAAFVVNKLNSIGYDAAIVKAGDSNEVDRLVTQHNPDVVILEALWVTPAKLAELLRLHRKRRWIVRLHSKAAFLAMEGVALEWINSYNHINDIYHNLTISCNNEQFNKDINSVIQLDSVYLPNIYFPLHPLFFKPNCDDGTRPINIACFGAVRPLKNQFQQAIAAILFAQSIKRTLNFHMNGTRAEQLGENVIRNIRGLFNNTTHNLVEHDWYSHDEFLTRLVPSMDMGMQISFTESFNIVTADFVHAGVPIVVSHDVEWMPSFTRVDPNDTDSIVKKLTSMWRSRSPAPNQAARWALAKHTDTATDIWKKEIQ